MRLLVVEDEQSLREDITKKLQHSGYEVMLMYDGETASEYLAVEYYDLVLLDLNLPKIDGTRFSVILERKSGNTCTDFIGTK